MLYEYAKIQQLNIIKVLMFKFDQILLTRNSIPY